MCVCGRNDEKDEKIAQENGKCKHEAEKRKKKLCVMKGEGGGKFPAKSSSQCNLCCPTATVSSFNSQRLRSFALNLSLRRHFALVMWFLCESDDFIVFEPSTQLSLLFAFSHSLSTLIYELRIYLSPASPPHFLQFGLTLPRSLCRVFCRLCSGGTSRNREQLTIDNFFS